MPLKKNITFKELDQAVKAAFQLGKMEGEADVRTQLTEDLLLAIEVQKLLETL